MTKDIDGSTFKEFTEFSLADISCCNKRDNSKNTFDQHSTVTYDQRVFFIIKLRAADPSFSPKVYGHTNLSQMLQGYPGLELRGSGSTLAVRVKQDSEQAA